MSRLSLRMEKLVGKVFLGAFAVFIGFPIYWILNTALKSAEYINTQPPTYLPKEPSFTLVISLLQSGTVSGAIIDSAVISTVATTIGVFVGSLAGYGFSRYSDAMDVGRIQASDLAFWLLATRTFPGVALVLPVFFIWGALGLRDTYLGLIILYFAFGLSLITWLMMDYFNSVPRSYEEAARIDGYSMIQTFVRVVLPMVKPGLIAVYVLTWVATWNEFFFAFILSGEDITPYTAIYPSFNLGTQNVWNALMGFGFIVSIPPVLILLYLREHLINVIAYGAGD